MARVKTPSQSRRFERKTPSNQRTDDISTGMPCKTLGKHLLDDMTVNVGQSSFEPVVVKGQALVIQTHQVKDGGIEVVN